MPLRAAGSRVAVAVGPRPRSRSRAPGCGAPPARAPDGPRSPSPLAPALFAPPAAAAFPPPPSPPPALRGALPHRWLGRRLRICKVSEHGQRRYVNAVVVFHDPSESHPFHVLHDDGASTWIAIHDAAKVVHAVDHRTTRRVEREFVWVTPERASAFAQANAAAQGPGASNPRRDARPPAAGLVAVARTRRRTEGSTGNTPVAAAAALVPANARRRFAIRRRGRRARRRRRAPQAPRPARGRRARSRARAASVTRGPAIGRRRRG